jgi:predicted metal-binding membrane protein
MERTTSIDALLRRDRLIVLAGIVAIAGLAWAYVVYRSQDNDATSMGMGMGMGMGQLQTWGAADFGLMYLMWAVMMAAMMVPSAAPMVLLFSTVNRRRREQQRPYVSTGVFLLGYVTVWCGFALAATLANWGLHANSLLSSTMGESTSAYLGGGLLLSAGVFQWSRLKYVCLTHCRSPIGFLMSEWREGTRGALKMGLRHGAYCVGCCWVLMALLFVLGVMNLLWIAALAGFVLLEKAIPGGQRVSRLTGVLLAGWGAWMVVSELMNRV